MWLSDGAKQWHLRHSTKRANLHLELKACPRHRSDRRVGWAVDLDWRRMTLRTASSVTSSACTYAPRMHHAKRLNVLVLQSVYSHDGLDSVITA